MYDGEDLAELKWIMDATAEVQRGEIAGLKRAFLPYTQPELAELGSLKSKHPYSPNARGLHCDNRTAWPPANSSRRLRVFMLEDSGWSWGRRVCGSMRSWSPEWVCWTDKRDAADVEIIHVDNQEELEYAQKAGPGPPSAPHGDRL